MPTPGETAQAILEGLVSRQDVTFLWFREAMIREHPEPLDDEQIHAMWMKYVAAPLVGDNEAVNKAIMQAMSHRRRVERDFVEQRERAALAKAKKSRRSVGELTINEVIAHTRGKVLRLFRITR